MTINCPVGLEELCNDIFWLVWNRLEEECMLTGNDAGIAAIACQYACLNILTSIFLKDIDLQNITVTCIKCINALKLEETNHDNRR